MRIASVTVARRVVIQGAPYEPVEFYASVTVELEPGDDVAEVTDAVRPTLNTIMYEQAQGLLGILPPERRAEALKRLFMEKDTSADEDAEVEAAEKAAEESQKPVIVQPRRIG